MYEYTVFFVIFFFFFSLAFRTDLSEILFSAIVQQDPFSRPIFVINYLYCITWNKQAYNQSFHHAHLQTSAMYIWISICF